MKYGLFIAGLIAASTISTSHASNAEQVKSNFVISSYAKTKYPSCSHMGWEAGFVQVQMNLVWIIGIKYYPI